MPLVGRRELDAVRNAVPGKDDHPVLLVGRRELDTVVFDKVDLSVPLVGRRELDAVRIVVLVKTNLSVPPVDSRELGAVQNTVLVKVDLSVLLVGRRELDAVQNTVLVKVDLSVLLVERRELDAVVLAKVDLSVQVVIVGNSDRSHFLVGIGEHRLDRAVVPKNQDVHAKPFFFFFFFFWYKNHSRNGYRRGVLCGQWLSVWQRRSKDYVPIFFILRTHCAVDDNRFGFQRN